MAPVHLEQSKTTPFEYFHAVVFYCYRCPETFRMKQVGADAVAVFDVKANRLLNELAALLNIPQVLRAGIQRPRIERTLWKLGDARIGPVLTPVWLARGLSVHVDEVYQSLHIKKKKWLSVIW